MRLALMDVKEGSLNVLAVNHEATAPKAYQAYFQVLHLHQRSLDG